MTPYLCNDGILGVLRLESRAGSKSDSGGVFLAANCGAALTLEPASLRCVAAHAPVEVGVTIGLLHGAPFAGSYLGGVYCLPRSCKCLLICRGLGHLDGPRCIHQRMDKLVSASFIQVRIGGSP